MEKIKEHIITDLANDLKVFNRNDILVNLNETQPISIDSNSSSFVLSIDALLKKSYQSAQQIFKESGAHVFCLSDGILNWEWKGSHCKSPVLLCPAQIKFNKIKQEYTITFDGKEAFINPFLVVEFQKIYDFEWPTCAFLETEWETLESDLKEKGFSIDITNESHYGNFHHHRFNVLRDVEFLEQTSDYSHPLIEITSSKEAQNERPIRLTQKLLFPSDNDQQSVFSECLSKNLVVQGPPGTGKSQVLSNFIAKTMYNQSSTLVVSEKRVALEVLKNKLSVFELDKFCFLPKNEANAHSLIQQLKETWLFLESCELKEPFQLDLSSQKIDALQFKLDLLSKPDLIGGIGFSEFQILAGNQSLTEVEYNSNSANISSFLDKKIEIQEVYKSRLNQYISYFPYHLLSDDAFRGLDKTIHKIEANYRKLKLDFSIETKSDLFHLMKNASFAQLLLNENTKEYFLILKPNSTERKKFNRLVKKELLLRKEIEILEGVADNWKIKPSKLETKQLLEASKTTSFLQKFSFSRRMKKLLKSSFIPPRKALEDWFFFLETEEKLKTVERQLIDIGVSTENDKDWIRNIIPQITPEGWANWSNANSVENKKLAAANSAINSFYQDLRTYLVLADDTRIETVFELSKTYFEELVKKRSILIEFNESLFQQIGKNSTIEDLEKEILKSSWIKFVGQFPAFESFNWSTIVNDLNDIIESQNQESKDFSTEILIKIKHNFDELFQLLKTTSRKLSPDEKSRKSRLKKGRSLLIKEFSKTRSHPTVRELLNSDASEWINVLLPVWMANPAQVADFFPLKKEQFEFVLFDEATQIPLVNSLGSLYRSKRAIVVGDEQQMTPTHFFKAGESEPLDLLHQARFTWDKVVLKHHYRSQNPELIAFSNRHFYNNELIAYPSAQENENPLQLHFVKDGKFINRQNEVEAKAVVKELEIALKSNETFGVVAFSETQLSCIYHLLSSENQQVLEDRLEMNSCFFRALENIQGDECDHLIISLGYAPNEEGKLLLNFGPLNRKSGGRRLNVLLSRAKKRVDFYTSIQSSDLVLSTNDSLNLLRQFLKRIENKRIENGFSFPHSLNVDVSSSKFKGKQVAQIKDVVSTINSANELVTLHRVLSERNWEIDYN